MLAHVLLAQSEGQSDPAHILCTKVQHYQLHKVKNDLFLVVSSCSESVDGLAEGIHDGISEIKGEESYCVVSRSRV